MAFNENNIGKLVQTNSCKISPIGIGEVPEFAFIVGYNYFKNQYVVSRNPNRSNCVECVSARKKTYSSDKVIAILDKYSTYLQKYVNDAIIRGEKLYLKVWESTPRINHRMELSHLSNACHETYSRLSHVETYLNALTEKEIYLYGGFGDYRRNRQKVLRKEQRELQKALRRLHKRFVFFFGEDAELVEEAIQKKGGPLNCSVSDTMKVVNLKIKHLEETKKEIASTSRKFPKTNE